jgi:UDP-N-acetylmuramoyl-L-alanyl-D-glutamate--2,6-diaminopimelate ligase
MLEQGCQSAVMEVSSHALALKRVDGMRFAAAVFTNLTRDHLDFHEDMEQYFAAKRRLFEMLEAGTTGVVNADDPRAPALIAVSPRAITYGITQPADVTPGPFELEIGGLTLDVRTPRGSVAVRSSLVGRPNVYNILAAAATAVALDLPLEAVARGVHALPGVPGRFEVVSGAADDVTVVVDYAHTDDALRNLLETARPLASKRLVTVFGCGGDRDTTKRPLMGMVAARLSDVVIVTSDNPRSEDPARIIDDIRRGITPASHAGRQAEVSSVVDRAEAIERAVSLARTGDLVLIAGKGHEKYQQIGDRVLPFDDVAVAREALKRRLEKRTRAV